MDIGDYIRVFRTRWRIFVSCALVGLAVAGIVILLSTPMYEANSQLFLKSNNGGSLPDDYTASTLAQQRVQTYVQFLPSRALATEVVARLGLTESPSQVESEISASAPTNTVLLNISVRDRSPILAQKILQEVDTLFIPIAARLEGATRTSPAAITLSEVSQPLVPTSPVTPRKKLDLGLGLLIGLAVGAAGAVLRQTLDVRIAHPSELTDSFNTTLLTTAGYDPNASKVPLIVHEDPRSPRAESFRRLRTNLQFAGVDDPPRSLVVTSSVPAEGKTTTAVNLAIAMAEAGVDVVLVEGDLRRPRVADYLGIEGSVGLTNVLIGTLSLDEAMQKWGPSGRLSVLPSGPLPPNPSEVLGSKHMAELIKKLESRGLVIIDAPPLLPVTDAALVSTRASGVVVVVRARSTRRDQLHNALESLHSVGARVYGTVWNMAPTKGPDGYGNAYGYGYGAYYADDKSHPDRERLTDAVPVESAMETAGHGADRHGADRQGVDQLPVSVGAASSAGPAGEPPAESTLDRLRAAGHED